MDRNNLKKMIVYSLLTVFFSILVTLAVCSMLHEIYLGEPSLKYWRLTLPLGLINGIPSLAVGLLLAQYALSLLTGKKEGNTSLRLYKGMEKALFSQAGITFLSVNAIGILENVGPPFIFIISAYIIATSLMLGSLFKHLTIIHDS